MGARYVVCTPGGQRIGQPCTRAPRHPSVPVLARWGVGNWRRRSEQARRSKDTRPEEQQRQDECEEQQATSKSARVLSPPANTNDPTLPLGDGTCSPLSLPPSVSSPRCSRTYTHRYLPARLLVPYAYRYGAYSMYGRSEREREERQKRAKTKKEEKDKKERRRDKGERKQRQRRKKMPVRAGSQKGAGGRSSSFAFSVRR